MNREPESHIIRISILVTEHGRKHEKEKKTENKKKNIDQEKEDSYR